MSEAVVTIEPVPSGARVSSMLLKGLLVLMLALALLYPETSNLRDKGAGVPLRVRVS